MKKLLFFAFLLPVACLAQSVESGVASLRPKPVASKQAASLGKVRVAPARRNAVSTDMNKTFGIEFDTIGQTTFDVQTNAAIYRKIVVHSGGKVSAVWTYAANNNSNHPDRGTGYNYFDGTNWSGANLTRFEPTRAGYNGIVSVTMGGTEQDLIYSHRASGETDDTIHTGGLYLMKSGGLGNTNFSAFDSLHVPNGPMWARMAASGNYVHVIATYASPGLRNFSRWNVKKNGVWYPTVYSRYNLSTNTWDKKEIVLPGYDSTHYWQGDADDYSIDARGNTVAIVMGGLGSDVALWKSTDNGDNWKKTILDSFTGGLWNPLKDDTFGTVTHLRSNEGCVHVVLDKNAKVHAFWPVASVMNDNATGKDSLFSFFLNVDGILYWNETATNLTLVASTPKFPTGSIGSGTTNREPKGQAGAALYGDSPLSTWPSAAVDNDNNIYLFYSAHRLDLSNSTAENFRHIFYRYSTDGGSTWSDTFDISTTLFNSTGDPKEDAYPSVARDADDQIHITWQRDDNPGTSINNKDNTGKNYILYAGIPLSTVKSGKIFALGLDTTEVGISKTTAANFSLGACYPNPAKTSLNIPVQLVKAGNVSVRLSNMLGQEIISENYGTLSTGKNTLTLDVSKCAPGVYFYQVKVGSNALTQKVIIQ